KRTEMDVTAIRIIGHRVEKHPLRIIFEKNIQGTNMVPGIVTRELYKSVGQKHMIVRAHSDPQGNKANYRNCQGIRQAGLYSRLERCCRMILRIHSNSF
ncbi:hypothetical protein DU54_02460, partial [Methanosarcina mazei]